jgi:hypothetical protein
MTLAHGIKTQLKRLFRTSAFLLLVLRLFGQPLTFPGLALADPFVVP